MAEVVDRAVTITQKVDKLAREDAEAKKRKNPGSVKAFLEFIGEGDEIPQILELRHEVSEWVGTFSLPWVKAGT